MGLNQALCLCLILGARAAILTPSYFPSSTDSVSCTLELQRHKDGAFRTWRELCEVGTAKNPCDGGEHARGSETSRRHLVKPNVTPAQGRRSDSDRVLARRDRRPLWAGRTYPLFLAMEPHQPRTSLTTTRARSCKRKGGGSSQD